ncbi:MAG: WD40 repeat domain-containing protein, partial [Bryobacterales bacterium]|nr:WD40 repeat domain-containing protein [Bryobacterales bacterium]
LLYSICGSEFTPLPAPSDPPTSFTHAVRFSPDSLFLAVANWGWPDFLRVYSVSNGAFGSATVSAQPPGVPSSVRFTPDADYLAVAGDAGGTPANMVVTIYKRSGSTFNALASPFDVAPSNVRDASFSTTGTYLAVTSSNSPYIFFYKRNGDSFTKLADVAADAGAAARVTAWSHDDAYVAVGNNWDQAGNGLALYARTGDTFTRIADVAPPLFSNTYFLRFRH